MGLAERSNHQDLVFRAALLAGMGRQSASIAAAHAPAPPAPAGGRPGRTCIDNGGPLLFSLFSARPRELGIVQRQPGGSAHIQPWLRTHYRPTAKGLQVDQWKSCIFTGDSHTHLDRVRHIVREAGSEVHFHHVHAQLGRQARFIFAMQPTTPGRLPAWIGWQLDKGARPATVLRALGWEGLWHEARQRMQRLLGTPLTHRSRPWSIAVGFGVEGLLVRIGSTIWARQAEDRSKHRRMVAGLEAIGGDGLGAEALYKLLMPHPIQPFSRVGRTIEIEFLDHRFQGIALLLAGGS